MLTNENVTKTTFFYLTKREQKIKTKKFFPKINRAALAKLSQS
jgi:hypothetical protein